MSRRADRSLGTYLFEHLRAAGVTATFGLPGDFALPLYKAQEKAGMRTVVCAHEPGAAFAADAYARLRGLGVALATYGAGALNMVNAVAMSYAEHTPLLVVSAAPDTDRRGPDTYVHHMVKSFDSQFRVFREITTAQAVLDDPATAAREIDRVIDEVLARKRPGYLEIPRDRVHRPIQVLEDARPQAIREAPHDDAVLNEAMRELAARLETARQPVLYVGVGVRRYGLTGEAVELAEHWGLPVVSSVMGKASFPESHPCFAGVYMGAVGDVQARKCIESSDCVLALGVIRSDVNTGFWTSKLDPAQQLVVGENSVFIRYHHYEGLPMARVVRALAKLKPKRPRGRPSPAPPSPLEHGNEGPLTTAHVIEHLRELDHSKYSLIADVGNAWFIGLELRTDIFLAPGYYATMGFGVPAALGAALAMPERKPLVLVGDGAFRMTGAELGVAAGEGLHPIVLLLNNGSYGMLQALDEPESYYALRSWDYLAIAQAMGCRGGRAGTPQELAEELRRAQASSGPYLVEVVLSETDYAPILSRIGELRRQTALRGGSG